MECVHLKSKILPYRNIQNMFNIFNTCIHMFNNYTCTKVSVLTFVPETTMTIEGIVPISVNHLQVRTLSGVKQLSSRCSKNKK